MSDTASALRPNRHVEAVSEDDGWIDSGKFEMPRLPNQGRDSAPPGEHDEPGFAAEEDIPLDGPDPVGEKMIEELKPGAGPVPKTGA